ncbi:MAG: DUF4190 domain-containing protein [Lachnospiraceae bacterium]|nr:DUF4190 domain-containing protein [Lachnospiraceae bacterium]
MNTQEVNGSEEKKKNGSLEVWCMVLGISGVVLGCACIGIIPSIIGVILSFVALSRHTERRGLVIAGLITSIIGIVIPMVIVVYATLMPQAPETIPNEESKEKVQVGSERNEENIEANHSLEQETDIRQESLAEDESMNMLEEHSVDLSYDLTQDASKGLLYSNTHGQIVDIYENVIPEYSYITVLENGSLSDGECILEGLFVGAGGEIIFEVPGTVTYYEPVTYKNLMRYEEQYVGKYISMLVYVCDSIDDDVRMKRAFPAEATELDGQVYYSCVNYDNLVICDKRDISGVWLSGDIIEIHAKYVGKEEYISYDSYTTVEIPTFEVYGSVLLQE